MTRIGLICTDFYLRLSVVSALFVFYFFRSLVTIFLIIGTLMTRIRLICTDFLSAVICCICVICVLFFPVVGNYFSYYWNTDDTDQTDLHGFFICGYLLYLRYLCSIFSGRW